MKIMIIRTMIPGTISFSRFFLPSYHILFFPNCFISVKKVGRHVKRRFFVGMSLVFGRPIFTVLLSICLRVFYVYVCVCECACVRVFVFVFVCSWACVCVFRCKRLFMWHQIQYRYVNYH